MAVILCLGPFLREEALQAGTRSHLADVTAP